MLPVAPHESILEIAASADPPQLISTPTTVTGCLSKAGESDVYAFAAKKGDKLELKIDLARSAFPWIHAESARCRRQGRGPGRRHARQRDADLPLNIAADGQYRVQVRDLHRQGGPRMSIG